MSFLQSLKPFVLVGVPAMISFVSGYNLGKYSVLHQQEMDHITKRIEYIERGCPRTKELDEYITQCMKGKRKHDEQLHQFYIEQALSGLKQPLLK